MLDIRVNGRTEVVVLAEGETLSELLQRYGVDEAARGLAVAVNKTIVRRADWPACRVGGGDEIEIVRPFQGG